MELEKEKISRPYTHQKFWINKRSITQFVRRNWARDLRERKVDVIRKSLIRGNHFSEPLTVNQINDNKNNTMLNNNNFYFDKYVPNKLSFIC